MPSPIGATWLGRLPDDIGYRDARLHKLQDDVEALRAQMVELAKTDAYEAAMDEAQNFLEDWQAEKLGPLVQEHG